MAIILPFASINQITILSGLSSSAAVGVYGIDTPTGAAGLLQAVSTPFSVKVN
jgi:hypothetical protein